MWISRLTELTIILALTSGYDMAKQEIMLQDVEYSAQPYNQQESNSMISGVPWSYSYYGRPASPCAYDKAAKEFLGTCICPNEQRASAQAGDVGLMVCAPVRRDGACPDADPSDVFTPPKYHPKLDGCLLDCLSTLLPCMQPGTKCYKYHSVTENGTDDGYACMYEMTMSRVFCMLADPQAHSCSPAPPALFGTKLPQMFNC
ncbi:hypothetical protein FOL47_010623 [Perkinsus chesapeaki]|uniref:Uncharacterized protein n=1 Tax=Perkinsus chesapeaki TaxID=330153 RepID=A0A7J6MPY5_PERCH|nr:hypothetical protein FOL47_010623 [Perkinsus chesapeaki]